MTKRSLALTVALAFAAASGCLAAPSGVTVLARGACTDIGPVAGPWDVYEDMFQADAPTWLPAHTHKGIECTLGVRGTTMWWFHGSGRHAIPAGSALETPQGRVHTAGNDGPAPMAYFAAHVLVAGSPYRTLVDDPTAPAHISTNGRSLFHSVFTNRPARTRTFTTELSVVSLAPGASIPMVRSADTSYYTVISGRVRVGSVSYGQYGKWVGGPVTNPGPLAAVLGIVRIP